MYEWEPISGWTARYRCKKTGAIGYRGIVIKEARSGVDAGDIIPYKCKTCGEPASRKQKGSFYCEEHGRRK